MDYENKHKEEIIRATQLWKCGDITRENLEYIFPELAESKDEKIKKVIRGWIYTRPASFFDNGISKEEILAWIEKQSKQKETLCDKCKKEQPSHSCQDITALGRCAIEKQNEKSSICERYDKIKNSEWFKKTYEGISISDENIEPKLKFNIGDWVVFNNKHQSIYQIEKIEDGYYILRHIYGGIFRVCVLHDESLRLWTIKDTKPGDILINKANDAILIFKNIQDNYLFSSYCDYFVNTFRAKQFSQWASSAFIPATKEQRDILFKKMYEAGYEWDASKKKLKKIEQQPIMWSADDEKQLNDIIKLLPNLTNCHNWLKSLKDRVQSQNMWKPSKEQIIDFFSVHNREEVVEIDKRIEESQKEYDAKLKDKMMKVKDFPMTD